MAELLSMYTMCGIDRAFEELKREEIDVMWLQQAESKYQDNEVPEVIDRI